MRLTDVYRLEEAISRTVWHFTNFKSATEMVRTDTVKTSTNFLSTTRSLTGSYHHDTRIAGVGFELDGGLINHTYKGGPVHDNYWDDDETYGSKTDGQFEDRIMIPNGMKNFGRYIKSLIVVMPHYWIDRGESEDVYGEKYSRKLPDLYEFAKVVRSLPSHVRVYVPTESTQSIRMQNRIFSGSMSPIEFFEFVSSIVDQYRKMVAAKKETKVKWKITFFDLKNIHKPPMVAEMRYPASYTQGTIRKEFSDKQLEVLEMTRVP